MSELHEIIATFNTTEQQKFERFLDRKNKRQDVRNIALFRATLKGNENTIKAEIGENAFHVLNKRLKDNALDFIAFQEIENDSNPETVILKELISAKRLLAEKKYKLGLKILNKVEQRCRKIKAYTLLLEVYRTHISYAFLESPEKLQNLFKAYKEASHIAFYEEKLNLVYAEIRKAFNTLDKKSTDFKLKEQVEQSFNQFGIDYEDGYTFKTLYKIAEIVDSSGARYKNYHSVNLFFADKLAELKGGPKDNDSELLYHLKLIYLTANVYFRKRDFMISLFYLDEIVRQLQRANQKYYTKFIIEVNILKSLNNNYLGNNLKAIEILEESKNEKNSSKFTFKHKLVLTEAIINFHQKKFKKVYSVLNTLNKSDSFYEKQLGIEWVTNKKLLEILSSIEVKQTENLEARVISLRRKYGDYFKSRGENQFIPFLGFVKAFGEDITLLNDTKFVARVKNRMTWKTNHEESIYLQSFYAWLKAKVENTELYEATLNLIKK